MRRMIIILSTLCLLLTSGCVTVCESYVSERENGATQPLRQHTATPTTSTTESHILMWKDALTGETYYIDALTNETVTRPPGLNTTRLPPTPARKTFTRPAQPVITDTFEGQEHPRATLTPEKQTYRPDETVQLTVFYERWEGVEGESELKMWKMDLWQAEGNKWSERFLRLGGIEGSLLHIIRRCLIPEGKDSATATFTLPLNDYYDIEYGKRYKVVWSVYDSADKREYLLTTEFSTVAK